MNLIAIVFILFKVYFNGAYYYNKIADCKNNSNFCGIKVFDYKLSQDLRDLLIAKSNNAVRVDIQSWKYGKTLSTKAMPNEIIDFYFEFANEISTIIGENVYTTSLNLPTSCCLLIYDQPGDYMNWHFDVNYFDGRFFTVLIPITSDNSCTNFRYKNYNSEDIYINLNSLNKSVVFEGDKLFHMATKLCDGDSPRMVLSLQYTTNPNINTFNNFLMNLKDKAYVPVF